MKIKFFILFFFFCGLNCLAQNLNWVRHDSIVKAGLNQIYEIKFEQAEETFSVIENEYLSHPSGKFFKAMVTWWEILVNHKNNESDEILLSKLLEVIDLCDKILEKNNKNYDAILYKCVSYGLRAELHAIRKNWLRAVYDGKIALDLAVKCYEKRPNDVDLQFIFGFYHYFADVVFDKYTALRPAQYILPDGNRTRGLKELTNVAWNGKNARIEARFILQFIYYQFENNFKESMKWGNYLIKDYPDNPWFNKYYKKAYSKKNK